jgi:isoleucyl-tRNA synthetase
MSEENNYTIWSFLKKCHDRGFGLRGYDAMPWCGRCGTGISQMEMNEGYQLVAHRAVFVKFPLRGTARREPARLDHHPLDAHQQRRGRGQPGADLPQGEAQG